MLLVTLASLLSLFGCRRAAKRNDPESRAPRELQRLCIFYGWPSAFDGSRSAEEAAAKLAGYDVVVLGAGLERPDHGDHPATRQIIERIRGDAEVFGYIPLGEATGLDLGQIEQRMRAWAAMEVHGVFFDEAGYDFGNTRARQNDAFRAAHRQGLRVFANAFEPRDLFDAGKGPRNPKAAKTELRAGDCYLYESFGLVEGRPESEQARREKLARLEPARRLGVRIFGVTTSGQPGFFDAAAWGRVVAEARRVGLDGLGWGEHLFGARDNRMPSRPFPPDAR